MNQDTYGYGLWPLVIVNALIFVVFAFSFTRPRSGRDWRSLGAFSAFLVALFTEMYGFPLTIYLLSAWLTARFPGIDLLAHNSGHLWQTLFGTGVDPHLTLLHWLSEGLIVGGLILLAKAWKVLYRAQREGQLASTGPYGRVRHPQYAAFVLIMLGFLLQWPTLPTLILFPILTWRYIRLARKEEGEAQEQFGNAYRVYADRTPAFIPRWVPPERAGRTSPAAPAGASTAERAGASTAPERRRLSPRSPPTMRLNSLEFALMNNPLRAALQRWVETPFLFGRGTSLHGQRVLEIGCERGVGMAILLGLDAAGVMGIDIDPRMVALVQDRLARYGARARALVGDAEAIQAADQSFDRVVDFGILHHVPGWRRALREIARVLRPGGGFHFEDALCGLTTMWPARSLFDHPLDTQFTGDEFRAGLREAGLHIVTWRQWGERAVFGMGTQAAVWIDPRSSHHGDRGVGPAKVPASCLRKTALAQLPCPL